MTRRSPNRRNPHDDPVDCPDCESGVFVYRRKGPADGWQCGLCGWKSWIHGIDGVDQELVADGGVNTYIDCVVCGYTYSRDDNDECPNCEHNTLDEFVTDGGWPASDPVDHSEFVPLDMANNIDDERVRQRIAWIDGCGRAYAHSLDARTEIRADGGVETDRLRVERSSAITYGPAVDAEGYVLAIGTDERRVEIELEEDAMYTLWTEVKGTPWPEPDHIGEKDRLVRQVLHAANGAGRESLREALRVLGGERP